MKNPLIPLLLIGLGLYCALVLPRTFKKKMGDNALLRDKYESAVVVSRMAGFFLIFIALMHIVYRHGF